MSRRKRPVRVRVPGAALALAPLDLVSADDVRTLAEIAASKAEEPIRTAEQKRLNRIREACRVRRGFPHRTR